MKKSDIAKLRLRNQRIVGTEFSSASQVVSWLGAVQAQDYHMAKWALGLRMIKATDQSVEDEIDSGSIIRTHVLRPTWHFVPAADVRWMLELTGPRIGSAARSRQRTLELDAKTLNKSTKIIGKALEGGNHLTRPELMSILERSGIKRSSQRGIHIMFHAELEQLVCSGRRSGKHFTYALMDERVPPSKKLSRDEALAKLAATYFTSHGPATVRDFSWWSGLSLTEARAGLEDIRSSLFSETVEGEVYWMNASASPARDSRSTIHFLPAFDEFTVAYTDRTASLTPDAHKLAITGYAIFNPMIVVNGRIVGVWKRSFAKGQIVMVKQFLPDSRKLSDKTLNTAAGRVAAFHEMKPSVY